MEASSHPAHRGFRVARGPVRPVDVQRRRRDGRRGFLDLGGSRHRGRRDRLLSIFQAVCALEELAVQEDEAGMAEQCLSRKIEDPGSGIVRGKGPGEAHDGNRVHRGNH